MNLFKEALDALLVNALGGFQNFKVHPHGGGKMDKSLNVLGKAEAPEAQSGFQELRADARIEAHGVRNLLNVRANPFAEVRDHIGVADLKRQERVGSVFDQLR